MEARMPGGCVSEGKAPCSLGSGVADVPHSPGLVESCPPHPQPRRVSGSGRLGVTPSDPLGPPPAGRLPGHHSVTQQL